MVLWLDNLRDMGLINQSNKVSDVRLKVSPQHARYIWGSLLPRLHASQAPRAALALCTWNKVNKASWLQSPLALVADPALSFRKEQKERPGDLSGHYRRKNVLTDSGIALTGPGRALARQVLSKQKVSPGPQKNESPQVCPPQTSELWSLCCSSRNVSDRDPRWLLQCCPSWEDRIWKARPWLEPQRPHESQVGEQSQAPPGHAHVRETMAANPASCSICS